MPRLFIGLDIPPAQRMLLSFLQSGLDGARWVEASDLHITLRFIGDVSPSTADQIVDVLDQVRYPAPAIELGELACFGGTKPRSIYASVATDSRLMAFQAKLERLMQELGLPAEKRKFTPHVTLARFGKIEPIEVARYLAQRGAFNAAPYRPTRFILYSARDSVGGGPYHAEETFRFLEGGEYGAKA